jgi:hypothetical protein
MLTKIVDLLEKKNYNSLAAELAESLPCTVFLTPSSPNRARIEFGF